LKRKGISSVATVLIFLATIVAAGLVVAFFFISAKNATSQPLLDVSDAYYMSNSNSFILTLRNIGAVDVTIKSINVTCQNGGAAQVVYNSPYKSLLKGTTQIINLNVQSSTINDGDLCIAQVGLTSPNTMSLTISFRVVKP